jgi:hypothetical protein
MCQYANHASLAFGWGRCFRWARINLALYDSPRDPGTWGRIIEPAVQARRWPALLANVHPGVAP